MVRSHRIQIERCIHSLPRTRYFQIRCYGARKVGKYALERQPYPVVSRYTGSCMQGGQKIDSESNSVYQKTNNRDLTQRQYVQPHLRRTDVTELEGDSVIYESNHSYDTQAYRVSRYTGLFMPRVSFRKGSFQGFFGTQNLILSLPFVPLACRNLYSAKLRGKAVFVHTGFSHPIASYLEIAGPR